MQAQTLYRCDHPGCDYTNDTKSNYLAHKRLTHNPNTYTCANCGKDFSNKYYCNKVHPKTCKGTQVSNVGGAATAPTPTGSSEPSTQNESQVAQGAMTQPIEQGQHEQGDDMMTDQFAEQEEREAIAPDTNSYTWRFFFPQEEEQALPQQEEPTIPRVYDPNQGVDPTLLNMPVQEPNDPYHNIDPALLSLHFISQESVLATPREAENLGHGDEASGQDTEMGDGETVDDFFNEVMDLS